MSVKKSWLACLNFPADYQPEHQPSECTSQICSIPGRVQLCRSFHTSSRRELSLLAGFVAIPAAKLTTALLACTVRFNWQMMSVEDQAQYASMFLTTPGLYFSTFLLAATGLLAVSYLRRLKITPEIGRKRYIAFTQNELVHLQEPLYRNVIQKFGTPGTRFSVETTDAAYTRLANVAKKIAVSNSDLSYFRDAVWKLTVFKNEARIAFALPNNHIFLSTGMLHFIKDESQLSVVVAHEMAHNYLNHAADSLSMKRLLDYVGIILIGAIWVSLPSDLAILSHVAMNASLFMLLTLPYRRKMELEADKVGLKLMAKACYDVRESGNFFTMLTAKPLHAANLPAFLSSHPSHATRIKQLNQLLPEAEKLRISHGCPELSKSKQDKMVLVNAFETAKGYEFYSRFTKFVLGSFIPTTRR